jgi:O-antigen/teichoic acid export membrane protein
MGGRAFGVDVAVSLGTRVVLFGVTASTGILIARWLGPEGRGLLSICITIPSLVAALAGCGLPMANVYLVGRGRVAAGVVAGNALAFAAVVGGGLGAGLFVVAPRVVEAWLPHVPAGLLRTGALLLPLLLLLENVRGLLLAYRRMGSIAVCAFVRVLPYAAAVAALFLCRRLTAERALAAQVTAVALAVATGVLLAVRGGVFAGWALRWAALREGLWFGLRQHAGSIAQLFAYRLDVLILAGMRRPAEVGCYTLAVMLAEMAWYVPQSVGEILFPKTAADRAAANRFTPLVCRCTVAFTAVGLAVLFALAGVLIPWVVTARYASSVTALRLLTPGVLFLSVSKVLGSDLAGRGHPHLSSIASGVSLVLTVVLDLLWIPRYGIDGAAAASSVAYTANGLCMTVFFLRVSGVRLRDLFWVRAADFRAVRKALRRRAGGGE